MQENKHKDKDPDGMDNNNLPLDADLMNSDVPVNHLDEKGDDPANGLAKLQADLADQKDKYLRLLAEFDNYKRRSARENVEIRQTAGKEVILSLLDIMDDCDRAEKQIQTTDDIQQIKEGVQLVFNKLRSTLQSRGLKPMEALDSDFDVEKHEAITCVPVDAEKQGKVVDEIVKGYYLNDKLIRFAKVVVGS